MSIDLRKINYAPLEWEDRVLDAETGNPIVWGTPVNEDNLNRVEAGILLSHYDIGSALLFALSTMNVQAKELEKIKNQRILQGAATIVNTIATNGYFRTAEPTVTVALSGFAQTNAPNYDVQITPTSADDMGLVGDLVVYDKTQNGFKVKMTGSAKTVSFLWTLLNPNV